MREEKECEKATKKAKREKIRNFPRILENSSLDTFVAGRWLAGFQERNKKCVESSLVSFRVFDVPSMEEKCGGRKNGAKIR